MGDSTTIDVPEGSGVYKGKAHVVVAPGHEKAARMKKGVAIMDFVLRLGALASALAAAAIMGTSDQSLPFFTQFFQFELSYDDMSAFEYVKFITHAYSNQRPFWSMTLIFITERWSCKYVQVFPHINGPSLWVPRPLPSLLHCIHCPTPCSWTKDLPPHHGYCIDDTFYTYKYKCTWWYFQFIWNEKVSYECVR